MDSAPNEHSGPTSSAGDFLRVQRDIERGHLLVRVQSLALITVTGPDRLTWLNSLITQDILGLEPGNTSESLLLSPQGRIEHAFFVSDDGVTTWLLTTRSHRDALFQWLCSMVFRMNVEVTIPDGVTVVAGTSRTALAAAGEEVVVFEDYWPRVQPGSVGYASEPHPGDAWSLLYGVFLDETLVATSELWPSAEPLEALSIAAARPTMVDVDTIALPHELDWLRSAVHLNKGCYRGQETVAKVHNLGHPPRRLTLLHLDGSASLLPEPGDKVFHGETQVGHITRAAWHYEQGPLALALLKRNTPVDVTLSVLHDEGNIPAHQEVIVPPDAGSTRDIPRLGRLR
ncbi:MAG: hypothetical protein RL247_420 [Actinomycetota bacterium]